MHGLSCIDFDHNGENVIPLQNVEVEIEIRGFTAHINIKQTYKNESDQPKQVQFSSPVDYNAAFYKFEADIDGRKIIGKCLEKKKAEKLYKEAIEKGNTAILGSEHDSVGDILHLNLGNFPPGSKGTLEFGMIMELKVQTDGGIPFVLPTVFNPRYSPSKDINNPSNYFDQTMYTTMPKKYSIDVQCSITPSGYNIQKIISHTDHIIVNADIDGQSATITQDGGFKADHDWSLIVYYQNVYTPQAIIEKGDRTSVGLMKDDLLMMNFFPEVPPTSFSHQNEIIFVIDRSGSMQGPNIQSARKTLMLFLKSLPGGSLFNICSFGSTHQLLFPNGSVEYNEETLSKALELQADMEADMGGTEMFNPLKEIYSTPPRQGFSKQILLITDGQIWNVSQLLELINRHAHETRLFSIGIGDGASTSLVKGAAEAGKGRWEMVMQQDQLQTKVMGLMANILQESVHNVSIEVKSEPSSRIRMIPNVPPVIFGGQHLILYAKIPTDAQVNKMIIRGSTSSNEIYHEINNNENRIKTVHDQRFTLHRLAAKAQIKQYKIDEEDTDKEEIISLSERSSVVSKYTSFVGIDCDGKIVKAKNLDDLEINRSRMCVGGPLRNMSSVPVLRGGGPPMQRKALYGGGPVSFPVQRGGGPSMQEDAGDSPGGSPLSSSCCIFGSMARAPPPTSRGRHKNLKSAHALSSDDRDECDFQPLSLKKQRSIGDSTMQLQMGEESIPQVESKFDLVNDFLSQQNFDGSWNWEKIQHILVRLSNSSKEIKNDSKYDSKIWATAIALSILEKQFDSEKIQWVFIAEKAKKFIQMKNIDVDTILDQSKKFIASINT